MKRLLIAPVFVLLASSAFACSSQADEEDEPVADEGALTTDELGRRGAEQIRYPVAGRPDEICIVSKRFGGAYSDKDTEKEKELCGFNFHEPSPGKGAAICPKDSSTNPGVDVHELDGKSKAEVEGANCTTDKIGKFKQSVTCSYTGSLLGYYHVSRLLGGAVNVPPSVVRTMDLEKHKALVTRGLAATVRVDGPGFDVHDAWKQYQGMDANPSGFSRAAQVYTADFKQLYGAFQSNVSGDGRHAAIRTGGGDPGAQQFLRTEAFGLVSSGGSLAERFSAEAKAETVTKLVLAKDVSDMVLMDELLSQADRYGNVHAVAYKVFEENGKLKKVRLKRADDRAESPIDRPEIPGFIVEEITLRDNDCGITKENRNAKYGIAGKLTHMSARTYKHFQWLAKELASTSSEVRTNLANEALLSPTDIQNVSKNATTLARSLKERCDSGALKLDADLRDHLSGASRTIGREACAASGPPELQQGTEGGAVDSHGIELVKR